MEPVWSTKSKWPCCQTSTSGFFKKNGCSLAKDCNTHGSQESNIFPIAVFLVIESIYRSLYTVWLPAVTGTKRAIYFTHLPFGSGSYFQGGNVVTYVLRTHQFQTSYFHSLIFFCSPGAVTRMFAMFRSIAPFLAIRVREPSSTSRSIMLAEEVSFPIVP